MGCLGFFTLKFNNNKKNCIVVSTLFYLGGVFGVFYAKIIIMATILVLHIKLSFHSISGYNGLTKSYILITIITMKYISIIT